MPNGPSRCNFLESIKTKRAGLGTAKEPQKGQKGQMGYWDSGILGYWDRTSSGVGPKGPEISFCFNLYQCPAPTRPFILPGCSLPTDCMIK